MNCRVHYKTFNSSEHSDAATLHVRLQHVDGGVDCVTNEGEESWQIEAITKFIKI